MSSYYTPTKWVANQTVASADKLNNIENGIVEMHERVDDIKFDFDLVSKDVNDIVANVTNGNENMTNNEIVLARKGEVSLRKKIDKIDEQFNTIEQDFNSHLDALTNKINIREINCLNPPKNLMPVKENIDSSIELQAIFDYAKENLIKNIYLPRGNFIFNNVEVNDYSLNFYGDGLDTVISKDKESMRGISFNSNIKTISENIIITNDGTHTIIDNVLNAIDYYKIGDIVKIYSSDLIDGMRESTSFKGEFKIVRRVSSNQLILSGVCRYEYLTNPRICKIEQHSYSVKNISLTTYNEEPTNQLSSIIAVNNGCSHELENIRVFDHYATGVIMQNCYGYEINGIDVDYLRSYQDQEGLTPTSISVLGYGIVDRCGGYFKVNFNSKYNRHGFTTNSGKLDDSNPSGHGISEYGMMINCIGNGGAQSSFDVHETSYGIQYMNCVTTNNNEHGLSLRGDNCYVDNCKILNSNLGINILNYNGTSNKGRHRLSNVVCETIKAPFAVNADEGSFEEIYFRDCDFKGGNYCIIKNSEIDFRNCVFEVKNKTRFFDVFGECTLRFFNCEFNFYEDNAEQLSTTHTIIYVQENSKVKTHFFDCKVRNKIKGNKFTFKFVNIQSNALDDNEIKIINPIIFDANLTITDSGNAPSRWISGTNTKANIVAMNENFMVCSTVDTTANLPSSIPPQYRGNVEVYDTTLRKKKLWNGTNWTNMDGEVL